jgi:hypothetical protein
VRIDEARHDDATLDVDVDRAVDPFDGLVRASVTCRDDGSVAHGDEAIRHGADVTGCRPDPRTLVFQRRDRQETRAVKDEIGLCHPFSTIFQ